MQQSFNQLRDVFIELVNQHRLAFAILLMITIATILTSLSMWLYVQSGASGLDLSRPGFSEVREDIRVVNSHPEFASEGIISESVIDEYLDIYRYEVEQADKLGSFEAQPLSDKILRFNITSNELE